MARDLRPFPAARAWAANRFICPALLPRWAGDAWLDGRACRQAKPDRFRSSRGPCTRGALVVKSTRSAGVKRRPGWKAPSSPHIIVHVASLAHNRSHVSVWPRAGRGPRLSSSGAPDLAPGTTTTTTTTTATHTHPCGTNGRCATEKGQGTRHHSEGSTSHVLCTAQHAQSTLHDAGKRSTKIGWNGPKSPAARGLLSKMKPKRSSSTTRLRDNVS